MKKIFLLIIAILSLFLLSSCGDNSEKVVLSTPKNIIINSSNGNIKWDKVNKAYSYTIFIDDKELIDCKKNEYNLDIKKYAGEYIKVNIRANSNDVKYINSELSSDCIKRIDGGLLDSDFSLYLKNLGYSDHQINLLFNSIHNYYVSNKNGTIIIDIINDIKESFVLEELLLSLYDVNISSHSLVGFILDYFNIIYFDNIYSDFIIDNKEMLIEGLAAYYDFICFYKSKEFVDLFLQINRVLNSDFTANEILIVKNSIYDYLIDILPSYEFLDNLCIVFDNFISQYGNDLKLEEKFDITPLQLKKIINDDCKLIKTLTDMILYFIDNLEIEDINEFLSIKTNEYVYLNKNNETIDLQKDMYIVSLVKYLNKLFNDEYFIDKYEELTLYGVYNIELLSSVRGIINENIFNGFTIDSTIIKILEAVVNSTNDDFYLLDYDIIVTILENKLFNDYNEYYEFLLMINDGYTNNEDDIIRNINILYNSSDLIIGLLKELSNKEITMYITIIKEVLNVLYEDAESFLPSDKALSFKESINSIVLIIDKDKDKASKVISEIILILDDALNNISKDDVLINWKSNNLEEKNFLIEIGNSLSKLGYDNTSSDNVIKIIDSIDEIGAISRDEIVQMIDSLLSYFKEEYYIN